MPNLGKSIARKPLKRATLDAPERGGVAVGEVARIGDELKLLGFSVIRIRPTRTTSVQVAASDEAVCILLSGSIRIGVDRERRDYSRRDSFLDLPCGVFLNPGTEAKFENIGENEAVLAVARSRTNGSPAKGKRPGRGHVWIGPEDIEVFRRGSGPHQRVIRNIVGEGFPARTLLCGETVNPGGNWSSFPPHKHDTPGVKGESVHEEVYLHLFDKPNGWGYQEVYSPEHGESVPMRIEHGDAVLIPYGYHPVTAAPGYSLCYFWVLAGPRRKLEMNDDPEHTWIRKAPALPSPARPYRKIISAIPHPKSEPLLDSLAKSESQAMHGQPPVVWDKALGYQVFDPYGNVFLDFSSGVLISNCGHNHPKVQEAIISEVQKGLLTSYIFPNAARNDLIAGLLRHAPKGLDKAMLFCTGSEAIECCVKLARTAGIAVDRRKKKVVSFARSFHGRTMGAQLAGGIPELKTWLDGIDSGKDFVQVPFPDGIYQKGLSFSVFERSLADQNVSPDQVCGVLVETYQGGIVSFAPTAYMRRLREWCDRNGALLIMDEVQAGFGRTGKWWGFEHYGIVPDLIACGKGISSSLPVSAVLGKSRHLDLYSPGSMSTTHSGNPVCCAAAAANLEVIENERLVENASRLERVVAKELSSLESLYKSRIRKITGRGLVWGIHLMKPENAEPDASLAKAVVWRAVAKGVLLFAPVGPGGATIKINPPLCISEDAVRDGLSVLKEELISELEAAEREKSAC